MNCAEYQRWCSPYIDDLLTPDERRQFEEHLSACASCRSELASLQQMLHALRTLEPPTVPALLPGIHERLARTPWWQAIWQRVAAPWPMSLPWHGLALAMSAAVAVLLVVITPTYRLRPVAKQYARATTDQMASLRPIGKGIRADGTFQLAQAPAQASQFPNRFDTGRTDDASSRGFAQHASSSQDGVRGQSEESSKNWKIAQLREQEPLRASSHNGVVAENNEAVTTTGVPVDRVSELRQLAADLPKSKERRAESTQTSTHELGAVLAMKRTLNDRTERDTESALPSSVATSPPLNPTVEFGTLGGKEDADTRRMAKAEAVGGPGGAGTLALETGTYHAPLPAAPPQKPGETAEAKLPQIQDTKLVLASPASGLQVQWHVADLPEAADRMKTWVTAKQGRVVVIDERHFTIQLPSAEVPEFLRQFASHAPEWSAPAQPLLVSITVELVPSR